MLLITRSNQALNHLFEKISASNIDSRHLVRLGHGHEDLDSTEEWGKAGRIKSFLELRIKLLEQVETLAASLGLPKEHAGSCETASYFYNTNIKPLWNSFKSKHLEDSKTTLAKIVENFPFTAYFAKISPGLFSKCTGLEACKQLAEDFMQHITTIFEEIDQVRPFELLKSNKDRSNYLLVKEARIIAMTSTHASLKRRELVRLGFKYDTVIMEEAGQMLEVETFIPLLLQSHDTDLNSSPLNRVILIGDHHQLPPIVQNQTLCKTSKMDQSLFARLIRLGVPTIDLDFQGRARPSIADLYRWNYKELKDLPLTKPEFQQSNAGFALEYQAINVEDYNGVGESFPRPHYVQNLGEAEYVVATYMYMRLLGYIFFLNLGIQKTVLPF
jgi:intron-binding protein aquarius